MLAYRYNFSKNFSKIMTRRTSLSSDVQNHVHAIKEEIYGKERGFLGYNRFYEVLAYFRISII